MASFKDLSTAEGIKSLDEYLLTRSYISGYHFVHSHLLVSIGVGKSKAKRNGCSGCVWISNIRFDPWQVAKQSPLL